MSYRCSDYIPERPLDPPEDKVFAMCDHCGGEIYEGEEYYEIDGDLIHEDCLLDYVKENLAIRKEADSREEAYCRYSA